MKNFTMIDEDFICENCHKEVKALGYTARDHCPYCLYSKHVDIMPGDRQNPCKGALKPIGIENFKDTYKILYHQGFDSIFFTRTKRDLFYVKSKGLSLQIIED